MPTLVHVAARPAADIHLDERQLGMAVELGERLCRPMQARWPLNPGRRQLCLSLDEPGSATIGDALFVQRELTGDLLDFYDCQAPGELERRGLRGAERLGPAALAMAVVRTRRQHISASADRSRGSRRWPGWRAADRRPAGKRDRLVQPCRPRLG
jgi:hypothetical protein